MGRIGVALLIINLDPGIVVRCHRLELVTLTHDTNPGT